MAKKERSFAAKLAKSAGESGRACPVCGDHVTSVKLVVSERSPRTGSWRYNQRFVAVCKCNEKEVYG
jgi:hypothetical protein